MSVTDRVPKPDDYTCVATIRGQEIVYYEQFGSYKGDWVMIAFKDDTYFIYKDYYGSCPGCDSLEAHHLGDHHDKDVPAATVMEFAKDYQPFMEIPQTTMWNLCQERTLLKILPANQREGWITSEDDASILNDMTAACILHLRQPFTSQFILEVRNAELKQRLLKEKTYEAFVQELGAVTVHEDGESQLIAIPSTRDMLFVSVKDSSTPRRYLLRVPPTSKTCAEAIAWTFNLSTDQYRPIKET